MRPVRRHARHGRAWHPVSLESEGTNVRSATRPPTTVLPTRQFKACDALETRERGVRGGGEGLLVTVEIIVHLCPTLLRLYQSVCAERAPT